MSNGKKRNFAKNAFIVAAATANAAITADVKGSIITAQNLTSYVGMTFRVINDKTQSPYKTPKDRPSY